MLIQCLNKHKAQDDNKDWEQWVLFNVNSIMHLNLFLIQYEYKQIPEFYVKT